nr:protein kinase [Pseudomonadota bacterium]
MTASRARRCPDCFQSLDGGQHCPHCGFDAGAYRDASHYLPLFTPLRQGAYLTGRVLGAPGTFGIVYAGWHASLDCPVAIKEYFPQPLAERARGAVTVRPRGSGQDLYRRWQARFLQEARLLARFRGHAHIVDVLDVFEDHGTACLVMERLRGRSLGEHLGGVSSATGGPVLARRLSPAQAGALLDGLLAALEALHGARPEAVFHRDLSLNNVFLANDDPARPKLLDFGLARTGGGPLGSLSAGAGTPGFAAPEQLTDGRITPATDLYALGGVLY